MRIFCFRIVSTGLIAASLAACSSQVSSSTKQSQNAVELPAVAAQDQEESSASISQTLMKLREIKTKEFDPNISPDAKRLLTTLKHKLRDLIYDTLNAKNNRQVDSRHLQAEILAILKRDGIKVEEPEDLVIDENYVEPEYIQGYGNIYKIAIQKPAKHSDIIAVTTTLSIPCGEDTSLYIFRSKAERWDLILARELNGYEKIPDAQSQFGYAISPPDKQNNFFVVTANISPWCMSNWKSIRYAVLRLGQSAYEARVILNEKHTIFIGHEPPFSIQVTANSFTLSFDGGEAMERMNNGEDVSDEEAKRSHIENYVVEGDQTKRIL